MATVVVAMPRQAKASAFQDLRPAARRDYRSAGIHRTRSKRGLSESDPARPQRAERTVLGDADSLSSE